MQPIQLRPIHSVTIEVARGKVALPPALQAKVDAHWQELSATNPYLFNGEAFTVIDCQDDGDTLRVKLLRTDYAHCMYTEHFVGDLGEYAMRIIHSAALVISSDNKLIFGAMSDYTSHPGSIVCSGGGIDNGDINDGQVDLLHSTAHELQEEFGLDVADTSRVQDCTMAYLKSGGEIGVMTVVYEVRLKQTSDAFMRDYQVYAGGLRAAGKEVEFSELFSVPCDGAAVEAFIARHQSDFDEYMPVLLRTVAAR